MFTTEQFLLLGLLHDLFEELDDGIVLDKAFAVLAEDGASGWEKGRVEKDVQDSRRRIWVEAGQRRFGSFTELNAWLGERCRALWRELRHPQHKAFSIAEMLELEQSHLMPMPAAGA